MAAASAVVASHRIVIFIPSSRCEQYRKRKQNPRYSVPFVGLSEPFPSFATADRLTATSRTSPREANESANPSVARRPSAGTPPTRVSMGLGAGWPCCGRPGAAGGYLIAGRLMVRRPAMCHAAMVRPEPTVRNARTRGKSDHPARDQADWTADDRPRKRPKGSIAGPLLGGGPKRCRSHGSSYYGYRCKQSHHRRAPTLNK